MADQPEETASGQGGVSRREFLTGGAGALLGTAMPLAPGSAQTSAQTNAQTRAAALEPSRPVLHIIGHSHIDAAWLWPWTDSVDVVLTTFRSALDRMNETPGFCYSHSSAVHYQWVEQADPRMFAEILRRIREGRWEVVGGWPVEPDCNIPSTESFARHSLYGKRYCQRALGVDVEVGFNPDSFGHAAGLPTLLQHAGYRFYVYMRPQEHEGDYPRLFWWEGPDGSRVLTYHIYGSYDWFADHIRDSAAHAFPPGMEHGAFFLGVGDHGGAVTRAQLKKVLDLQADPTLPELRFSTVRSFFAAVESSPAMRDLPVVRGDLQHHARGCYSAGSGQKFQNQRAEHGMFTAESVALLTSLRGGGAPYPQAAFADGWNRVLFNQFHDILAGTSLFSDYQDARDGIGYACELALEAQHLRLAALARQVDLHDVPEGAVFAYNPLPWPRRCLLEFPYARESMVEPLSLGAPDGTKSPLQKRPSDSMTDFYPRLSAWVDLPACGYQVYTLDHGATPAAYPFPKRFAVSERSFGLSSLRAADGTELLSGGLGLVVIEDKSDTWAHGVDAFDHEIGRPEFISSKVVEDGPVTRVTRQHLRWRSSTITVDVAEFAGVDAAELRFVIDWHEHEQILKFEVPVGLPAPAVFAKVPGAVLQRAADGNEQPYQEWIALEGQRNGATYTLALMNRSLYSCSCKDGLLRTILIRSAPYARHNPNPVEQDGVQAWQDQGRQERVLWLTGGQGKVADLHLDRTVLGLKTPAEYVLDSRHTGTEPRQQSFLEIGPATVEVLAVKQAIDGGATVVRLQERAGRQTAAHLRSRLLRLDHHVPLRPWELKTLLIQNGAVREADLLELPT